MQTEEVGCGRWTWRATGCKGEAVVFDLDGVLSDAASRQHFLKGPKPDWEAFFTASAEDPLVDEVAVLLDLLAPGLAIVLLTARPARIGEVTMEWLERHDLRWDLLVMRRDGERRPARNFKQAALRDIRASGFELKLCFEDDLRNVEMFRAEGVPALYIHSGYYD
ncbi:MAG: HAD family acid phosphatase [Acidimicrobiales bacterium]